MDSLTQATLGAAVGELVLGKRLGNRAIGWGALLGTLPDLDILFSPLFDNAGDLWWHRGPSHSALVTIAASLLLGPQMAKLWKKDRVTAGLATWFVFLIWSTHVLIDCFTTYGTAVLWPFSSQKVAFNIMAIIDPLFTLPMLIGVIGALFLRRKNQLPKRRKINGWGLGLASLYAVLAVGLKFAASASFESDLARRGVDAERRIESPTIFNALLWRSVVDRGNAFWVGYHSLLESPSKPIHWTIYPKGEEAVRDLEGMRELETAQWFADGWWIARPHVKGAWIGDLRFGEMRSWENDGAIVDHHLTFAWDVLPEEHDKLRPKRPQNIDKSMMLKQLGQRILGSVDNWQAAPRLEGVTGSLPEILAVEE